ncbi:amino acid ABC transporter substrate-binding protein [Paralcaligenes sp. KSB-10]|jgi:branched-chain amino acid transport system substrate-binding protein|uniref:amino acid ABC transporter substrate-binding protein n=1 Tax=Paralcaligenes sp. KSB-10 TaxID=2901142 RepID=UPI001E39C615|nr:amino acid ABC transporter substrate-binding protein [Paralcaligenes sp. KSB-10]UHL66155.1 amino acid ABC transporter substrate-binding protein [Paralcaligenes sp. KSB-10]
MLRKAISSVLAGSLLAFTALASAASAPSEIKIGTLYASSGPYAAISMPVYRGLQLWVSQENAQGGVMVKPYGKRIPIKLVSYDDQSNTATAATLYNQLITQDKVDLLVSDSGSVLTSVAVPIAREHKKLLFDQTGTGGTFFTDDNPYIALMSDPVSTIWPKYIADFLTKEGPKLGIKRIALLYATNDFTGTQANAVRDFIKKSGAPVELVYDKGVPTNTTNYTVLINNIRLAKPDAVIEMGYPGNDIAFLRNLHDSGTQFKWLFAIYPGLETEHMEKTVGIDGLSYVYTYTPSSVVEYHAESGMSLPQFRDAWNKMYTDNKVAFGFNAVAGYTTGLVIQNALAVTESMDQLALRKAVFSLSGKLKTIDGTFAVDKNGAQIGEITPLGQLVPDGKKGLKFAVVYPPDVATAKAVYPAPSN